jgi:hypothetical protein
MGGDEAREVMAKNPAESDYDIFISGAQAFIDGNEEKPPDRYKGEEAKLWLAGYDMERSEDKANDEESKGEIK